MYSLYYSPGSCSLIVNCLLHELEVPFALKRVGRAVVLPGLDVHATVARAMAGEGIKPFGAQAT